MDKVTPIDREILRDASYLLKKVPIIYKYLKTDYCISTIKNSTLTFTNPSSFNDPYDCYIELIKLGNISPSYRQDLLDRLPSNPYYEEGSVDRDRILKASDEEIKKAFKEVSFPIEKSLRGVSCFSEDPVNILMWSHYAEYHKGACIGFDPWILYYSIRNPLEREFTMLRVKYVKYLKTINYFDDPKSAIINWLRLKHYQWNYEKEIRTILAPIQFDSDNKYHLQIDKKAISTILLGSKMCKEDNDKIIEICRNEYPNIKIYKMSLASSKFQLIKNPLR